MSKVDQVALHTKDNANSSSIDTIRFNTKVNILETTNGWYKVSVNNKVGYVQKRFYSTKKQTSI